jgi:hypothetical protein
MAKGSTRDPQTGPTAAWARVRALPAGQLQGRHGEEEDGSPAPACVDWNLIAFQLLWIRDGRIPGHGSGVTTNRLATCGRRRRGPRPASRPARRLLGRAGLLSRLPVLDRGPTAEGLRD